MSEKHTTIYGVYLTKPQLDAYLKEHPDARYFTREMTTSMKCDQCGKHIPSGAHYFSGFTGHHAWGVNSGDSFRHPDFCSLECAQAYFDKYKKLIETGENDKTDFVQFEGETAHYVDIDGGDKK